ncbi:ATP-binding protein [Hyphococcus lacteus]|uniref:ATP-binding protein n=1 Tax=Hyphococcus lacteus TaxID=3143536 RepID=A0ABV3Z7M8_9PROT
MDDVCFALEDGGVSQDGWPVANAESIGPLLELHHAQPWLMGDNPSWLHSNAMSPLIRAIISRKTYFLEGDRHFGFASATKLDDDANLFTDFTYRARRAAQRAGFHRSDANMLTAAATELHGNILEHSEASDSGYIAFAATENAFEFVVADRGIGVLRSLRQNPKFAALSDAGTALELALTEGNSRFADEPDRGRGFRPIFIGLANVSDHVRFRSDDHARELIRAPDGAIPAHTSQKPTAPGFFSFVRCVPIQ